MRLRSCCAPQGTKTILRNVNDGSIDAVSRASLIVETLISNSTSESQNTKAEPYMTRTASLNAVNPRNPGAPVDASNRFGNCFGAHSPVRIGSTTGLVFFFLTRLGRTHTSNSPRTTRSRSSHKLVSRLAQYNTRIDFNERRICIHFAGSIYVAGHAV